MSEGAEPTPYEVLRGRLMDLRWRAGNPSYRQMGALWKGHPACAGRGGLLVFAPATIADNLNGKRRSMSAPFVRFFVLSCLAHASQAGIDLPAADLTKGLWHDWWSAQAQVTRRDEGDGAERASDSSGSAGAGEPPRILASPGVMCKRFQIRRGLSESRYLPHSGRRVRGAWWRSLTSTDGALCGVHPIEVSGRGFTAPEWFPEVMRLCAQIVEGDPLLRRRHPFGGGGITVTAAGESS